MGATLSYVCGASDEPLLYKTVGAALEDAAAQWPERIALIVSHQAIRWSYRYLNDATDRLAAGLLCLGLVPGDRIGIWSPNRYDEAQVFGIPDARYGEVVCAWIKLKPDEYCDAEAMRRFCAEQIAHYKVPQHIRFVSEFPMTVTGKIQKFVMRERMIEELDLNLERGPT